MDHDCLSHQTSPNTKVTVEVHHMRCESLVLLSLLTSVGGLKHLIRPNQQEFMYLLSHAIQHRGSASRIFKFQHINDVLCNLFIILLVLIIGLQQRIDKINIICLLKEF